MSNIAIGQYLPYDTFIHRLDPRVKLIASLLFIITIFFVESFVGYIHCHGKYWKNSCKISNKKC